MRVIFMRTCILETEGRNKGPRFEQGSVHDLPPASAQRWIRRGAAVIAADDPPAAALPAAENPPLEPAQDAETPAEPKARRRRNTTSEDA